MTNDNRFNNLSSELDAEDVDEDVQEDRATEQSTREPMPQTTETTTQTDDSTDSEAFDADETAQRPAYARESTWDAFDDALDLDVERELRDREIRGATKREKIDAVLRLAIDQPGEVARLVEQARRER